MGYVIRTEALGAPHYFAGYVDGMIKPSLVLAEVIMNAWVFEERDEAVDLIEKLPGDNWSISGVSYSDSGNLKTPKKPRPTFENDIEIVAEYEYGDGWLLDTMEGRRADYARIRALKNRGVYEAINNANAAEWEARKAWIMAFGTKREQKELGCTPPDLKTEGNGNG